MKRSDHLTVGDVRSAGHCMSGLRAWCQQHGFDYRDFVRNGIALSRLAGIEDGYLQQILERKRERESAGGI